MRCPICGSPNLTDDFLADHEILDEVVRIETALHCDDCGTKFLLTQKYELGYPFDIELKPV